MFPKHKYLLLAFLFFGFTSFQLKVEDLENVFQKIDKEVDANSKAYSSLSNACATIGHRLTGSANGKKAEEFAHNLLKSYGFQNVKYHPFQVMAWSRDTAARHKQCRRD